MPREAPVTSAVRPSSENSSIGRRLSEEPRGTAVPCHTDAVKRWWHVPKFSLRSVDVAQRLDMFLVCAIAAVLGNRFFLILTGYPQLGNGTLHISHAIWGALMMAIAIIFAISVSAAVHRGPSSRSSAAPGSAGSSTSSASSSPAT